MIVLKDFKYLCFLVIILISNEIFSQNSFHKHYYVQKNTTIDSTSNVQASEIFRLKELLKLKARFTNVSQSQNKKIDSLISTLSPIYNSSSKMIFEYNDEYLPSAYNIYRLQNRKWDLSDKVTNKFDQSGRIIKRNKYLLIEDNWQNDFQEIFEYNEAGNEIFHLTQGWENSNWVNWFRTFSNYDSLNNFIGSISYTWIDSLWELNSKSELNYNFNNQVDEVKIYIFEGRWKKLYFTKYYYDESGQLDSLISKRWNGSDWSNPIKLYYDTLKNGQVVNENIDVWYNNQWFKSSRIVYHYDKDKYFLHAHCEYWQGDRWLPNIDVIHVQNPDGFEIHYFTHQLDIYYEQPTSVIEENPSVVNEIELEQNYPNPFNPSTTIKYSVSNVKADFSQRVILKVYDVLGKEVRTLVNEVQEPGKYSINFDASDLSSGIYLYSIKIGSYASVKKMILTK